VAEIDALLQAGQAPDVCLTYNYPTIQAHSDLGRIIDLNPLLGKYRKILPDLWNLLGDALIYFDQDPRTGAVIALEGRMAHDYGSTVFVREDWLEALGINPPETLEEFETMLRTFATNASALLGADAASLVPLSISSDIGWRAAPLIASFIPDAASDEELYTRGHDARHLLWPGFKAAMQVLNEWYNEGLILQDFPDYTDTAAEVALIESGYVGAFMEYWDYPYRSNPGIHAALQAISADAAYIAIDPFRNDAGAYRKYLSPPIDRKIFLPSTNTEPLASLLYLNWISKLENRRYLQIGDPDVDHTVLSDDSIAWIRQTGERIMNSGMNIDYTITLNGLDLGDATRTILSIANSYPGVDKRFISASYFLQSKDVRRIPLCFNRVGASESALRSALQSICQTLLTQALTAALENFDAVFNAGLQGYLDAGGQTIIDERRAIYQATH